jgi:hypothetical protein
MHILRLIFDVALMIVVNGFWRFLRKLLLDFGFRHPCVASCLSPESDRAFGPGDPGGVVWPIYCRDGFSISRASSMKREHENETIFCGCRPPFWICLRGRLPGEFTQAVPCGGGTGAGGKTCVARRVVVSSGKAGTEWDCLQCGARRWWSFQGKGLF